MQQSLAVLTPLAEATMKYIGLKLGQPLDTVVFRDDEHANLHLQQGKPWNSVAEAVHRHFRLADICGSQFPSQQRALLR